MTRVRTRTTTYPSDTGFTIVELLVVIVVIGVLAAITIVSYTGISNRAKSATLMADLTHASNQLKLYQIDHSAYPTDLNASNCPLDSLSVVDDRYCLKSSSGNTFTTYTQPSTNEFILDATNTNGTIYRVTEDSTPALATGLVTIAAIGGTKAVGSVLTAGALTPSGATVTYQWQTATTSGGTYTNIAGATASTYTLVAGDLGDYIKVVATGSGSYTGSVTSAATTVITTPLTSIGVITGTPKVATVLTAGAIAPAGGTGTYQWQTATTSGGTYTNIAGATASTYTPVVGDIGDFLKVVVTANGNYTGTVTSAATTVAVAA